MPIDISEAYTFKKNYSRSIVSCNIHSYNKNNEAIKELVEKLQNPSCLLLQEVWQPKINMNLKHYHPPINELRTIKKGGGLSIFVHHSLNYKKFEPINKLITNNIEKLAVVISDTKLKNFLLVNIYRPPNVNFKHSLEELKLIFREAHISNIPMILCGDLNIDTLKNDINAKEYLNTLQTFQFNQIVKEPTRISIHKKSLIDHVVVDSKLEPIDTHVLCHTIADHLPILTIWHKKKEKVKKEIETITKVNYKKLESKIKESVLPKLEHLDCNDSLNQLHDFVTSKVEECTYTVPKKDRPKNPWITRETIQQGRLVNRLHKKFIKNNNAYNEYAYKNAKREHQKMRRNDKNKYFRNELENCKGDSYKTWQIINQCLNRTSKKNRTEKRKEQLTWKNVTYNTDEEISNCFNNFYKNIANDIVKRLENSTNPLEYYLENSKKANEPFEIIEVTENEIEKTVMSLKGKSSTGFDGISNKILKKYHLYQKN